MVFDTLARLIRHTYGDASLVYARNVTDVDDKIIAAAEAEGVEPAVITERFERHYLEDMRALGVRDPDVAPHATAEIGPMIAMIERLVGLGNAYVAEGHVLFIVPSDADYGALSAATAKRSRRSPGRGRAVQARSGGLRPMEAERRGRPWLESPWAGAVRLAHRMLGHDPCALGRTIDIHGGGLDLIFPIMRPN